MDVQECLIDFASCIKNKKNFFLICFILIFILDAYTTNDIIYQWDDIGIELAPTANGALPNFEISALRNDTCHSKTNTGLFK